MRTRWGLGLGRLVPVLVMVAALDAQGTAPAERPARYIVIGCLERGPADSYLITDFRSGVAYRVEAPADQISWHVGHRLEIHGTLHQGSGKEPTLKAESIIYISRTCSTGDGGKG